MTALSVTNPASQPRRGAPLALLGLLLVSWVSVRAAVWENPFPVSLPELDLVLADNETFGEALDPLSSLPALPDAFPTAPSAFAQPLAAGGFAAFAERPWGEEWERGDFRQARYQRRPFGSDPRMAGGHYYLMRAALADGMGAPGGYSSSWEAQASGGIPRGAPPPPSETAAPAYAQSAKPDRWSFDAFTFYRAGSASEAVSAGRVAIYGASQTGARLQYRLAPNSRRDPRAYVRAYQALVTGGESELAAGLSARPLGSIPVRAYGEVRVTDTALFGRTVRPAAYAVTELDPVRLPFDVALELYGGAGYVGGVAATPFADGQAVASRELASFKGLSERPMRISVGGGAWGGVQQDAGRLDVGPTMRLDFDLGKVPARVSVDWRERIVGEAEPGSGVAATLSTQF